MHQSVGAARSILDISSQASLFMRMVEPPVQLPDRVRIDPTSPWHTSALLSTAMETVSLPARLRPSNGIRSTMRDLEDVLRRDERQHIAVLRLGVGAPSEHGLSPSGNAEISLSPRPRLARTPIAHQILAALDVHRSAKQPDGSATASNGGSGTVGRQRSAQFAWTRMPCPTVS